MMSTIIYILVGWIAVSIPVALLVGRWVKRGRS